MQQYTIRQAVEADQKGINHLIRDAGINPLGIHWSRFLVAFDDSGTPIGCAQVKRHRDGSSELASLVVTRQWRRRGVAAALINRLKQEHGAPLWLTCMDKLVPFYMQFDFWRIKTPQQMPAYFRRASRFFNLYLTFTRGQGELTVMVWHNRKYENLDQTGDNAL